MKKIATSCVSLVLFLSLITFPVLAQDGGPANPAGPELAEHVPGELLVRFSPGMNSAQVAKQMADMGVTRKREIPAIRVKLVKLSRGLSVEQALARFSHLPGIEFVEPNYILHTASVSKAEITDQWGLTKIRAEEAWLALDGDNQKNEVLLATVDTGIDSSQSDLSARIWNNADETPGNGIDDDSNGYIDDTWGWDFVNNDNDPTDDNMHGTAVSGVMVAEQDGAGMVGVCPWCRVMAVKVLSSQGSGSLDVVASGIIYAAENGARVINLSLAGAAGTQTLGDAVNFAWGQGVVVVAAAGNDGLKTTVYPAGYAFAIAVGSTNLDDKHSCFSNYYEDYISVAAPGEGIYVIDINDPVNGYNYYSGTSLAAPHVSGLAGLILGQNPGLDNTQVRLIIEDSSVDLGTPGTDAVFGHGRIDAYQAITGIISSTSPPDGLSSNTEQATAYAYARKLVRDSTGMLHLIWHTYDGSLYRIRYATSTDNGSSWDLQPDVFSSPYETYHPALAADDDYLYVAIPSRTGENQPYQILFTRKSLTGGSWSSADSLMGGAYNAVRPDLYLDPSNGRLHLIVSSLDDAPYLYYRASNTQGASWEQLSQFNPSDSAYNTRYATIHANGDNLYIATRVFSNSFIFTYYYLFTARSTDGGLTWIDQTQISSYLAFTTGEYGVSLAGVGDRLYMAYEVGSNLYFRRYDGANWSNYLQLETGDTNNVYKWPTITQADDGQAWMLFEVNKQLYMRHYDGSNWQPKESIGPGTNANLKLGSSTDRVEWISTNCSGSPFDLVYGSRSLGSNPPTPTPTNTPTSTSTPTPTNTPTATSTPTPTPTSTSTPTDTPTPTPTQTPPVSIVDAMASGEIAVAGTVSGNYIYTHDDGGNIEVITEIESGGKPQNRYSLLEHKWIFNVTPGNVLTLYANAWSGGSSDGDNFNFAYSTDDASYVEMFTVSNTSDAGYATHSLPASIQGTVYVRVTDSNRDPGNRALDNIYVDHLFIRSESQPGAAPAAPIGLIATSVAPNQIDLAWSDKAIDEYGFQIERSLDGISWSQIDSVGANVDSYSDSTVSPNTTYYYQVRAYNASGSSDYSNSASATTPEGIGLEATGYKVKGLQTVELNWMGGSAPFIISRNGKQLSSTVTEYTYTDDIGLKGGGSYQYQVCEANSPANCSNIVQVDF